MTRSSTAAPILAVLAIGLVTLGAFYAGAYLWLPEFNTISNGAVLRHFGEPGRAPAVYLGGMVESRLRGVRIVLCDEGAEFNSLANALSGTEAICVVATGRVKATDNATAYP